MYNYPLTLLLRSRMTLLPLDFDHFTPNLDNSTPIQKGYLAPKFIFGYCGLGIGGLGWLRNWGLLVFLLWNFK